MFFRIIFLLFLYFPCLFGSLVISEGTKSISDFSLAYHYDETSGLGIEEINDLHFTQTIHSHFSQGYKEGTAWFKITIENKSTNRDFVLCFTEPFWSTFNLYEPTPKGWIKHQNGLSTPLKRYEIQNANPTFKLKIAPGTSKTYFIQGQTVNAQMGAFTLYTENEFFRPSRFTLSTFYPFYSGILFIILILNIFLLLEMRERIYAYYIGYVSAFIIFVSMFNGSYLYLGFHPWNAGLHVTGTIVLAFMALFSGTFLELDKYFPRMDRLFKFFTGSFLIFGILIHFNIPYSTFLFNILSTVFVTILLILAIKTWLIGKINTPYYLIALIIYMPTMGMMVLMFNGLLENNGFTRYAFLFGALVEIIFFSLILAKRFQAAKDEKIHFQIELLAEKEKNQEYLEYEIERQRHEINEKNAILFHQARDAAMGEMISMIAHQWRQPLNTLALINENLYFKHKLGQWDEEGFECAHDQFNEHLQYMSKTIDDFRNYYKNDHIKRPENIGTSVELALRLCDVFLNYAKIKTELIVSTEKKGYLSQNELIQVLMNLIKNSHDAILERHIVSGKITITVEEAADALSIRVCDNGGGISDDIAAKIFEPYFSTKSENGTGLGLYMSKAIIEEHFKGTLAFYNTETGACFTVLVPAYDERMELTPRVS
ncbi:sensor histidine kinase [Sulfuricurvum sp.]|uniref:sensor histidine kinase n=1 Tax=Sulfuricurvum sp. TaxID=2025608 RepID=UPI003C312E99